MQDRTEIEEDKVPPIPQSVVLKAVDVEIYICFTRKHLSRRGLFNLAIQEVKLSDISNVATTPENGHLFHKVALSFALIFFGAQHRRSEISTRGYAMHGVALEQLHRDLSDPKCYTRDEIFICIVTLTLLECLAPTGPKHYLQHIAGLERLLELRGPGLISSPNSPRLYRSLRHMLLFASLRTRRSSILSRIEWKSFLRDICEEKDIQEQDLFDTLADCTVLMAECDKLLDLPETDLHSNVIRREDAKLKAIRLLMFLGAWRKRWGNDVHNAHQEVPAALTSLQPGLAWGNSLPPWLTIFEFLHDSASMSLMFYNTVLIYVLRILIFFAAEGVVISAQSNLHQEISQGAIDPNDLRIRTKAYLVAAERGAAWDVLRCLLYYLARRSEFPGGHDPLLQLAMNTIWTVRDNESAQGLWMTHLLRTQALKIIPKGLLLSQETDGMRAK